MTGRFNIPNLSDILATTNSRAAKSAAEAAEQRQLDQASAIRACNKNINKSAQGGYSHCACDLDVGEAYVSSLRSEGFKVDYVNTCDEQYGCAEANEPCHYLVSWSPRGK